VATEPASPVFGGLSAGVPQEASTRENDSAAISIKTLKLFMADLPSFYQYASTELNSRRLL
jgi:hypothetical protein